MGIYNCIRWWFIFLLPLAINGKEREVENLEISKKLGGFVSTFRDIQKNKMFVIFIYFLYIDGVHTIMSLHNFYWKHRNWPIGNYCCINFSNLLHSRQRFFGLILEINMMIRLFYMRRSLFISAWSFTQQRLPTLQNFM